MVRNDTSQVKIERLQSIAQEIAKELKNKPEVSGMNVWVQYNIGLTEKKASEYIDLVCLAHDWKVVDGRIQA